MPLFLPTPGIAVDKATVADTGVQMQMPMRIGETEKSLWLLPLEPLVAVRGRNVITRRLVSKYNQQTFGSVKELWTKDDYEIIITGMLYEHTKPDELPAEMITRFNALCSLRKPLIVRCALLEAVGVNQIVIQDWELPPTPGIEFQAFTIRAFSDQNFNLLIER